MHDSFSDLAAARALVLAHGWNSTAYQILNPGMALWFSRERDAVAGYSDWGGIRVVAGAPVCALERLPSVVAALEAEASAAGRRVCYFAAGARLEGILEEKDGYSRVGIGSQPVWKPAGWPAVLAERASLRAQLHRVRNKGVTVREWSADEAGGDAGIHRCLEEWLARRHLPPMGFLVEPRTLERLWDRKVFVAELGGRPVAFLVAAPVPRRGGWLIEQIVRGTRAPNGTAEILVDAAFCAARAAGLDYLTLGLSPLSRNGEGTGGGNSLGLEQLFGWLWAHGSRFYDFRGLESFKAKFGPSAWEPIHAISQGPFDARVLLAVAAAFAGGSPVRFVAGAFARVARRGLL
ncbi:MAG TPA: DUF2156 domain-containing protein [Fibrobacteria bacterium]|nr:DUF2156 domain-containing protein [Fibrobacteria bacterium]